MAWPTSVSNGSRAKRSPAAPTTCTVPISALTAGSTGARAPSPGRPTSNPARSHSSPAHRTSFVAAQTDQALSRSWPEGWTIRLTLPLLLVAKDPDLHLLPASWRRQARRSDPCHLWWNLRQDPRPDLRAGPQVDGSRRHARASAHGACRAVRPDSL